MPYSKKQKEWSMAYEKKHLKRISLNVQKTYFDEILFPAAQAAGEPVNTYIKRAIETRLALDREQTAQK